MNTIGVCAVMATVGLLTGIFVIVRRALGLADGATMAATEAAEGFAKAAQRDIDASLRRFQRVTKDPEELASIRGEVERLQRRVKILERDQAPAVSTRLDRVENRLGQVERAKR